MANEITNYQCPACTGPLRYDGASGKLRCDYCDSEFTVSDIEALYAEDAAQSAESAEDASYDRPGTLWGEAADGLVTYNCPSCGAALICDESTAAGSCPYCGNPGVIAAQFAESLKPDYVLPFKLDRESAKAALKKYYKGKKLLPRAFADENHIEEIKGLYVPFWLFDSEADADMRYLATRVHSYTRGNERVTVTEHFRLRRAGTVRFDNIPADASSKMPDAHMDAIEPFDYSDLKPFSAAYLPGFLAEKYDVSADDCAARADERARNTAADLMAQSVMGYATCVEESRSIRLRRKAVKYALMPVWTLVTKWNGQTYLFAMNGQTGKLIGDLPVSKGKALAWFAGIAAPLMALLALLLL